MYNKYTSIEAILLLFYMLVRVAGENMSKRRLKKGIFARKISKALDLPFDGVTDSFRIEMHGDAEALINGCEKILEYGKEKIKLRLKGRDIEIYGRALECMTYLDGTVEIKGVICDLKLGGDTGV